MSAGLSIADPGSERGRIGAALIELVAERGLPQLGLSQLCERAGVDQARFERHFADLDDCFAQIWAQANDCLIEAMTGAFDSGGEEWRQRVRAALVAGMGWLAAEPQVASLYVVNAIFAGDPVRHRRQEAIERLGRMIDGGRAHLPDPDRVPYSVAEGIAGGILHRAHLLVGTGRAAELPGEVGDLMYVVVLPYLGLAAAEVELLRPPP